MKRHVPVREIAKALSCSSRTIQRLARAGAVPSIRFGREYRLDPDAVVAALRQEGTQATRRH